MSITCLRLPRFRLTRFQLAKALSGRGASAGFNLVELLVAVILVTLVVAGTSVAGLISHRAGRPPASADEQELEQLIQGIWP